MNPNPQIASLDHDPQQLLLLYSANELEGQQKTDVEEWLCDDPVAREYLRELRQVEDILGGSDNYLDSNAAQEQHPFVKVAITKVQSDDAADSTEWSEDEVDSQPVVKSSRIPSPDLNGIRNLIYLTAGFAAVFAAISAFMILSTQGQENVAEQKGLSVQKQEIGLAKLEKDSVRKDRIHSNPPSFPKRKIKVDSKLLAKIRYTRNKMKSFRKRIENRS